MKGDAPRKDPGLGKGYVSPLVPLASFDEWNKTLPAYPHIPPAPRYTDKDWINNMSTWLAGIAKILGPVAHSLTGAALGLLLVFRTNSAYARVYDARCIWGQLTNTIREMARLAQTNMQGLEREHALMLTAALPTLMLNHLQSHDSSYRNTQWSAAQQGVLTNLLSEHDFKCIWAARNRPMCCAKMIGAVYRSWFSNVEALKRHFGVRDGRSLTDEERMIMAANVQAARVAMERQLEIISNCYGACERIVRSNIPAAYSRHTSRFLSMWCFTLPFVLVHSLQWVMVPAVALICWSLFVIEEVGHAIEDPFNVHMYIGEAAGAASDILIIEGSQSNLREDTLERNPGPTTRLTAVERYALDELDYDVTEWHLEWKRTCLAKKPTA